MDSIVKGVNMGCDKLELYNTCRRYYIIVFRNSPLSCEEQRGLVLNNIAKYVVKMNNTRAHVKYVWGFMFCQVILEDVKLLTYCCRKVLSVLNVILNFLLMNWFLSGKFYNLGWRWLQWNIDHSLLPGSSESSLLLLSDIFPKMTICTWKQIGTGGKPEVNIVGCHQELANLF